MNQEMREMHFESLRKLESNSARSSFAIRGGKNLCLPLSAFRRDLAVTNPPGQGPNGLEVRHWPGRVICFPGVLACNWALSCSPA
jgi:hypothetical protein